jgi:hypothetical protein
VGVRCVVFVVWMETGCGREAGDGGVHKRPGSEIPEPAVRPPLSALSYDCSLVGLLRLSVPCAQDARLFYLAVTSLKQGRPEFATIPISDTDCYIRFLQTDTLIFSAGVITLAAVCSTMAHEITAATGETEKTCTHQLVPTDRLKEVKSEALPPEVIRSS